MALSRFLRRAAPLVVRSSSFCASASASASASRRPLSLLSSQPQLRRAFSTSLSPAKETHDASLSLLHVIDSEIKCAQECDDHHSVIDQAPQGFPFQIDDQKGMNILRLTRTYQAREQIEVIVSMPSLVTGDEEEEEEQEQDDDGSSQPHSHIPITVRVSKDDAGPTLEFACTAYPDEVVIDSMSVIENHRGEEDDLVAYEGPDFNDLDENLQKALHKYLELRGITPLNTNFLHEYMINKDSREYLLWLRNLKAFIQK